MINTLSNNLGSEIVPSHKIWTGKVQICTLFAEVYFLNHILYFPILRTISVDKIVTRISVPLLLVAKIEGLLIFLDKTLQARVVNIIVKVRVDSPLIVQIEQPDDICSFDHYQSL